VEVDKKAAFPPGHCRQLSPFIFMRWEEHFTQKFSTHPYQRDAGTSWALATTFSSLLEDQPKLPLTSEDWTHDTINIDLPAVIPSGVVAGVPRGV
jgi:hypothetical protein